MTSRLLFSAFKHFCLDQSTAYMKQGKYFEAYGLLKTQYKLGPKIHFAPVFVKYYVSLMETDQAEKSEKVRDELAELLREKFEESAEDVCKYAEDAMEKNKYWEAILFFQIALMYCEKGTCLLEDASLPESCAGGLAKCIIKIFDQNPGTKKKLKQHVIHWIKKARDTVAKASENDKKISALIQANLLGHQGRCLLLFRDFDAAEKSFNEAIALVDQYHKPDAEHFRIFSDHIGLLGIICFQTNRHDEAEKHLRRAIAAAKEAKDMKPFERGQAIRSHELILKKISEQK